MRNQRYYFAFSAVCLVAISLPVFANSFETIDPDMSTNYSFMSDSGDRRASQIRFLRNLDEAIKANPKDFQAYMDKGKVLRELENNKEALQCYSKAIELNPASARGFKQRAVTYVSTKQYKEAAEDLDIATKLAPTDASIIDMCADIHSRSAAECYQERDFIGAIKHLDAVSTNLEKVIEKHPESAATRFKLGVAYMHSAKAAERMHSTKESRSRNLKARVNLEYAATGNYGPPPVNSKLQARAKIALSKVSLALGEPKKALKAISSIERQKLEEDDQIEALACEMHAYEQLSEEGKATEIEKKLEVFKPVQQRSKVVPNFPAEINNTRTKLQGK